MKKLVSILVMVLCALSISAQEKNMKGFWRAFELMLDTTATTVEDNVKYKEYIDKNIMPLNMEVFQVIEDTDSASFCLVKTFKDSKYDYNVAFLETINEVVFEGKEYKNEKCFLAGTYTYETKGKETKTVPYYMTVDAFIAKQMDLFNELISIKERYQKEE